MIHISPTPSRRRAPSRVAVGYLRRSTDRQEQSIPDQKKAVERYADENDLQLSRFFIDDAISGTDALRRPGFQEMVAQAQQKSRPFSYVVVYDVKRFGRLGNDEAGYYRHILRVHGVEVLYTAENFSGDATDDLLRPVKQWQAREESKDLSKVTIRGLLSRIEGGFWNGGTPPYGYDLRYESPGGNGAAFLFVLQYQPDGTKLVLDESGSTVRTLARGERIQVSKRDRCRLTPSDPDRVEVVRRIFTMSALDGLGLRAIANALNADGIPSPRGPGWARIYSGHWTVSSVRSILTNPLYVGDLVWNRRTDARFFKIAGGRASERHEAYGARLEPNPTEDWIRIPSAHPGLVSHRLFQTAQHARSRRSGAGEQTNDEVRKPGPWNGRRARYLLSGLIECGRCGGRYEGCSRTKGKRRKDGSAVRTYYYGCGSYIRKGKAVCRFGPIPQERFERLVVEAVLSYYARYHGEKGHRELSKVVRDCIGVDSTDLCKARDSAQHRLEEIETDVSRLLDALTEGSRVFVEERLQGLSDERGRLERKLREIEEMELTRTAQLSLVGECREFLHDLPGALDASSPEVRVRTIRRCVQRIVIDRDSGNAEAWINALPVGTLSHRPTEKVLLDL